MKHSNSGWTLRGDDAVAYDGGNPGRVHAREQVLTLSGGVGDWGTPDKLDVEEGLIALE